MANRIPFLTARWQNLALITYRLPPAMLEPFLPPRCELDLIDGHAFASLVAFDFNQTRVLGVAWPGFVNFPEINLRFYVCHNSTGDRERGVCFIREFVPQRTVALLARTLYNEPYIAAPMHSAVDEDEQTISVHHQLTYAGRNQSLDVTASASTTCPAADSTDCFFKEHEWGFGTSRRGKLIRYRVVHPVWNIYPVLTHTLDWDFGQVYGPAFAGLNGMKPFSVILAQGSPVMVYPYGVMR